MCRVPTLTKAIVLIFVLPDCPICNSYIPEINRLQEEFAHRGVTDAFWFTIDPEMTAQREAAACSRIRHPMPPSRSTRIITDADQAGATIAPEAAVFSATGEILYRGRIDNQYAGLGKRRTQVTSHDLRDALGSNSGR